MSSDLLSGAASRARSLGFLLAAVAMTTAAPAFAQRALVITQESDENEVGMSHTVDAAATEDDTALVGVVVTFSVLSGPNAGASGTCAPSPGCTTDEMGRVSFTYLGDGGAGVDSIQAYFVAGEEDTVWSNILGKTWVGENQPPVARCQDVTVEAPEEGCEAEASIDDGSFDPDEDEITLMQEPPGPYPVGETAVRLIVTDAGGAADTCTATVTVLDVTPPEIAVELDHEYLWPPNHKLWEVCATVSVADNCDSTPDWVLASVTSNEPDDQKKGGGDGNTKNDIQGADTGTADPCVRLRAERRGNGDGRIYTLVFTASDSSGNTGADTVEVHVAHDQGHRDDSDDDGEDTGDDAASRGLGLSAEEYGAVRVDVFDVQGRKISAFMLNMADESTWDLGWDGKTATGQAAPSGIYFYRITTPLREMVRRVVITR